MDSVLQNLDINIKVNTSQAINGLNRVNTSLNRMKDTSGLDRQGSAWNRLTRTLWRTRGIITSVATVMGTLAGVGRSTIGEASDYIESVNLFNYAMGSYAEQAGEYAQKVQDFLGIDMSNWMQQQGTLNQMARGYGMTADEAYRLSQTMTNLAYDYASFYNKDFDVSFEKIRSAISGQVRPMRQFGVDLTQASLAQTALNHGIEKSVEDMSQAEKAYLRAIAIQDAASNFQGDMARTIMQPSNAMRVLGQLASQAGRAIGFIFLPFLQRIIPVAQVVVIILRNVAQAIASFFGTKIPKFQNPFKGVNASAGGFKNNTGGAAKNMGDAGKAADRTAKATKKASDNTKKTAKTVKKIKRELAGFDALNVLSFSKPSDTKAKKPSTPSTGGSGGGGGGGGGIGGGGGPIDFWDQLLPYDLFAGAEKRVEAMIEKIKAFGKIAWTVGKIIFAWKLAPKLFEFLNADSGLGAGLMKVFTKIGQSVANFFHLPIAPFAEFFSGSMAATLGLIAVGIYIIVSRLTDAIKNSKLFREGLKAILSFFNFIVKQLINFVIWLGKVGDSLGISKEALDGIKDFIAIIAGIILSFIIPPIGGIVLAVEGVILLIKTIGALMKNAKFVSILNTVKKVIGTVIHLVAESLMSSIKSIVGSMMEIWEIIKPLVITVGKIVGIIVGAGLFSIFVTIASVIAAIGKIIAKLVSWFAKLVKLASSLWKWIKLIFKFMHSPIGFLMELNSKSGKKTKTDIQKMRDNIANYLKKNPALLASGMRDKLSYFRDKVKKMRQTAQDWLTSNKLKVGAIVSTTGSALAKTIKGLAKKAQQKISNLKLKIKFLFDLAEFGRNQIRAKITRPLGRYLQGKGGIAAKVGKWISGFAGGGFPSYGELFLANENGNAEMIGSIGNRPAVANNEQIVSAVATGVTNAMISALRQVSSSGGSSSGEMTINVPVYLDNEVVAKGTVKYINGQIQRYGVSPITG